MKNFNLKLISVISIQLFVSYSVMAATCKQTVPDSALVKKGTLVMSTNPTLPPLQFVDSTGKLKGMRITLGKEVAKRLCLKPEYIRIEFSAMIPGLQAGRWDMINTGIFWNPKRAAMMNMIPYESAAISISVKKGNPLGISKQEDLAGKAVGVEIGGLEEKKLKEIDKNLRAKGLTPINIRVFDNFALAYQALRAGQTDASVAIDATAAEYVKRGEFDRAISGMFPMPCALAMKNDILAKTVLEAMNNMMEDGFYQELMDEYGLLPNSSPFIIRGP